MSNALEHKILSCVLWQGTERFGANFFQFRLQIILVRLLVPSAVGLVVVLSVFIQAAIIFIGSGLGAALIQKKAF